MTAQPSEKAFVKCKRYWVHSVIKDNYHGSPVPSLMHLTSSIGHQRVKRPLKIAQQRKNCHFLSFYFLKRMKILITLSRDVFVSSQNNKISESVKNNNFCWFVREGQEMFRLGLNLRNLSFLSLADLSASHNKALLPRQQQQQQHY